MARIATFSSELRGGEHISPAVPVSAGGPETVVSLLTDIAPADLLNPLLSLEAVLEVSFNNGVTWEHELGFTWRGGPDRRWSRPALLRRRN